MIQISNAGIEILHTNAEAARILGVAQSTLTKHARRIGLTRMGRDWMYSESDIEALRKSLSESTPGRPRVPTTYRQDP